MGKRPLTTLCLLATLALVSSLTISARQDGGTERPKGGDALENSLAQLERGLKDGAALDFRQGYARRTYVRLKRGGGCNVTFRVSQVPGSPDRTDSELSAVEWEVNLATLDAAEVKIETLAKSDGRVIRFATLGGKESIKWRSLEVNDARRVSGGRVSGGRIEVAGKDAPVVAAALQRAIIACRE